MSVKYLSTCLSVGHTCITALCWGLGESSLSNSSFGVGRMFESHVDAVITVSTFLPPAQ